jgi:hypothetical protein
MAYHHVIPFALLRDVWNRLVDQHIATALPEARVAIRQYLLLSNRNQPDLETLIDRIRAVNTLQARAGHHTLPALDVPEVHRLQTAAIWPAWDIVEGPRQRSDDPQDRYFDRFTSGLTGEEAVRMNMIGMLYQDFLAFVNAGPSPGSGSLRALAQAIGRARPMLYCERPIRFRAEMWVEERPGLWRKRRDGDRVTAAGR